MPRDIKPSTAELLLHHSFINGNMRCAKYLTIIKVYPSKPK